jgi:Fur family iron response transcriptional regulator
MQRPYSQVIDRLKQAGLRPTRQRMALAKLLFDAGDHHFSAEQLHGEASGAGIRVSLATVYNTLHQFTKARMLREIIVSSGRSYFDTNTSDHHHFFFEDSHLLQDIDAKDVAITKLPELPKDTSLERVDVVIRVSDNSKS